MTKLAYSTRNTKPTFIPASEEYKDAYRKDNDKTDKTHPYRVFIKENSTHRVVRCGTKKKAMDVFIDTNPTETVILTDMRTGHIIEYRHAVNA